MCHWVLRVWECGESYFTKYSSCSFDRAAHDPSNPLNPLHRSIVASKTDDRTPQTSLDVHQPNLKDTNKSSKKTRNKNRKPRGSTVTGSRPNGPSSGLSTVQDNIVKVTSDGSSQNYPRDVKTGKTIPLPLSEIGKASHFGDGSRSDGSRCNVFEVVLQSREATACPACMRSPKRARLPAYARGCFGLS